MIRQLPNEHSLCELEIRYLKLRRTSARNSNFGVVDQCPALQADRCTRGRLYQTIQNELFYYALLTENTYYTYYRKCKIVYAI